MEHGMVRVEDLDVYWERDRGGERSVWEEGKKSQTYLQERSELLENMTCACTQQLTHDCD